MATSKRRPSTAPETPSETRNDIFHVTGIPTDAVVSGNRHIGVDTLLELMGQSGLKFFRTSVPGALNGTNGLIAAADVVLIKVNAQWKYRGCTNSDLVHGLASLIGIDVVFSCNERD